ncbi:MAG TPA: PAS domain S-box protein [Methanospirillum sp.]|nr:PAS domain S-box protein [Methanospirillum sp.]
MDDQKIRILEVLSAGDRPITISDIAKKSGLDRHAVARHLDTLELLGKVKKFDIGAAKKYVLTKLIPVSSLIDISSDYILILDSTCTVQYVNNAAGIFLGLSARYIIGEDLERLSLPLFSHPTIIHELKRFTFETACKHKISINTGQWFEITIVGFSVTQGSNLISVIASDISEQTRIEEDLHQAEEKYAAAFQLSPDAITITDLDTGEILELNTAAEHIFGYSRNEIIGKRSIDVEIWGDAEERQSHLDNVSQHERFLIPSQQLFRKNHIPFTASMSCRKILLGKRRVILSVIRDISEQILADERLRISEEKYRLLADNSIDVIWTLDPRAGKFTFVSPSVEHLRGFTVDEVLNQPMDEVMTRESYNRIMALLPARITSFMKGDHSQRGARDRVVQPHKDGSLITTEVVTSFITDKDRNIISVLGISRDITEREQMEKKLRVGEEKFRLVAENIGDIVWVVNLDTDRFEFVNQSIALLGYSPEDMLGHRFADLMGPEEYFSISRDLKERISAMESGDSSGQCTRREIILNHKDGTSMIVDIVSTLLTGSDGKVSHLIGVLRDITRIKQTEKDLTVAYHSLHREYEELHLMSRIRHQQAAHKLSAIRILTGQAFDPGRSDTALKEIQMRILDKISELESLMSNIRPENSDTRKNEG